MCNHIATVDAKLHAVFFLELVYSSAYINKLLFSSEEGMAVGTNFYPQVWFDRPCLKRVTTYARHRSEMIRRMNVCFHVKPTPFMP